VSAVVVTGMGAIAAIGNTPREIFMSALNARSGVRLAPELATGPAVPLVASARFDPSTVTLRRRSAPLDRATAMALAVARQACAEAGNTIATSRTGVYWGTGMGGAQTLERCYETFFKDNEPRLKPTSIVTGMSHAAAAAISMDLGITGPTLTYSVACASSAIAIGEAMRAVRHGIVDRAIAGGSESLLTRGLIAAWSALRTLASTDPYDASRSCKPFAADRSGFVLGEGAGAIVLENARAAVQRGATIHAELAGFGHASDAGHISDPSADGQARALAEALSDAHVTPDQIGYINAHGTATAMGDRIEVASIKQVFGPAASRVAVSSTKALHGHIMGATGVIELLVAIQALTSGSIPPTAHMRLPDREFDLDFVPGSPRHGTRMEAVVSNSFAFGGSNAVLVARRHRPESFAK
jgi:3-oxoacyl-[acyl-carrier-protein] synthase II